MKKIAQSVAVINGEIGILNNDVKWIKKLLFVMIGLVSVAVGKILFFG